MLWAGRETTVNPFATLTIYTSVQNSNEISGVYTLFFLIIYKCFSHIILSQAYKVNVIFVIYKEIFK